MPIGLNGIVWDLEPRSMEQAEAGVAQSRHKCIFINVIHTTALQSHPLLGICGPV